MPINDYQMETYTNKILQERAIPMLEEPAFDVFKFCKEHNIECDWDFDSKSGLEWTEIFLDNKLVFQVDRYSSKRQFIELCLSLNKDFTNDGSSIKGDFWFAVGERESFMSFFKKHEKVFITNKL